MYCALCGEIPPAALRIRASMRKLGCLLVLFLFCSFAAAQKNELAVTAGGYFPFGIQGIGSGGGVEGSFAHRLVDAKVAAIYGELPVMIGFKVSEVSPLSQGNYTSFFVTPAVKLKLLPGFPASPWISLGGGLAHYWATDNLTLLQSSSNHAALQIGGGLDVKIAPFLSLRGELRDFYAPIPALSFLPVGSDQHNVFAGGGIVVRF